MSPGKPFGHAGNSQYLIICVFVTTGDWGSACFFHMCGFYFVVWVSLILLWELSTKFLFIVLDSKAPKSEDIDEEDDDVPGRHIDTFMST